MKTARVTVTALAAAAFEALALYTLLAGAPVAALALHVAAAGVLAEAFWSRSPATDHRALGTAWFWAAAFPIFGVASGFLLLRRLDRTGTAVRGESWEQQRGRAASAARREKQNAQQVGPEVIPLVEALRDRDPNVRVSAIDALRDESSKRAVRLLARARDNELYDVRFRAVESLGRISSQRLDQIAAARRALVKSPSAKRRARLARLCFDYADLELDSAEVTRGYFEQAVSHGTAALQTSPDPATALLVARAQARLGVAAGAEAAFAAILDGDPANAAALAGLAELQFARRDFDGLRATRERLLSCGHPIDTALSEALDLWTGDAQSTWASR